MVGHELRSRLLLLTDGAGPTFQAALMIFCRAPLPRLPAFYNDLSATEAGRTLAPAERA
jgi:hypothetical protein